MRKGLPAVVLALLMATLPACSDRGTRAWKWRSPAQNYQTALEAPSADDRRMAVAAIGESGYVASDDAFSVLDAVARTDPSSHVRCVAVSAFTRYDDSRPVKTLLAIFQATPESKSDALPASDDLRDAAAFALADLTARGWVTGPDHGAALDIFLSLSGPKSPRSARITALRALGLFRDRRVFAPLLAALRENDFCVADTAERSLIALTGTTHHYDPDAWNQWLANTANPFLRAGEKPPTTRPAGPSWWDQQAGKWKKLFSRGN
ncbi:MAG TPA: hypothetical protein PKG54_19300 [Phycisphaerae bacterium]|jgi:HEAT repeat protein|nr:hypothetical protein [Phycisphaerae bacterium]HOB76662.1 hypothetical protein [Phycisphaerae bacterium]HOJ54244.1 hypothetical protein [Phycisphaerae bacterium]HOL28572.1 hypothetical protein [Phycisphaerae bacterium]HPP20299.1 hypothetical protein [Phycisphaerae bacterium]